MLGEMYGGQFVAKYGDRPGPLWRAEIAKLTDDQLTAGFEALLSGGSAFPPSLPEFRVACLGEPETLDEARVEELAYQLIPSFDRQTLGRREVEILTRRNMDRARALLTGDRKPSAGEVNTLDRLGIVPGKALVRQ